MVFEPLVRRNCKYTFEPLEYNVLIERSRESIYSLLKNTFVLLREYRYLKAPTKKCERYTPNIDAIKDYVENIFK